MKQEYNGQQSGLMLIKKERGSQVNRPNFPKYNLSFVSCTINIVKQIYGVQCELTYFSKRRTKLLKATASQVLIHGVSSHTALVPEHADDALSTSKCAPFRVTVAL